MRMRPKVILPPRYLGKHPQMRNDIKHQNGLEIGIDQIRQKHTSQRIQLAQPEII